jgi:uncharacterized protein (DUF927 family)
VIDERRVVESPLGPQSGDEHAKRETEYRKALNKRLDEITAAVIRAVLDDAALPFIEAESADDESGAIDLAGDHDPIIDPKTGGRLSDAIKQAAETFRRPERAVRRLYLSELKRKWAEDPKEVPSEPRGKFYGRSYLVNHQGVWLRQVIAGLDDFYVWRRIAKSQIDPEAMSYDTTPQRNWQYCYRVTAETGEFLVNISAEHVGQNATRAINILVRHGVHLVESRDARKHLAKFLQRRPRNRIVRAPRTGWFEWRGNWVCVLPDEVLGVADRTRIVLDGVAVGAHGLHRAGTSAQWREHVARPLAGQSNVVLATGTLLAAPLLRWADEPGGGFHFYGGSKHGKTLAAVIGQSVWGKPFIPGSGDANAFGYDWDSTSGRLEERAVLRNDVGLSLDGVEGGDAKAIASSIYTLASGQGRGRMRQLEAAFSLMLLSTGEVSIAKFLDDEYVGRTVRLSDIPVEVQPGSAFENFRPDEAGKRFYPATREYHGAVGCDWLRYLVALTPRKFKPRLSELTTAFLAQPVVAEIHDRRAHSQVISVINRFALIAATLAMTIEAELLPWSKTDTDAAIVACMQRWLAERGNRDTGGELLREIEQRRQRFAETVNARFIHLRVAEGRLVPVSVVEREKAKAADQYDGYIKEGFILMKPRAWEALWRGLDIKAVHKHLLDAKLLIPDRDGKVPKAEKFETGTAAARFYVIAADFIGVTA